MTSEVRRASAKSGRRLDEHQIAGLVAEGVVDLLEVIQIDHDDRSRTMSPPGSRHLRGGDFEEMAAREELGKGIADRELFELLGKLELARRVVEDDHLAKASPLAVA